MLPLLRVRDQPSHDRIRSTSPGVNSENCADVSTCASTAFDLDPVGDFAARRVQEFHFGAAADDEIGRRTDKRALPLGGTIDPDVRGVRERDRDGSLRARDAQGPLCRVDRFDGADYGGGGSGDTR